jgi:DNA-binding transcriptional ArsR family regulator
MDAMLTTFDVLFKTLADPTRRAIFERLCRDGEQTVAALTAQAGVSLDRQSGRQTHYRSQPAALAPLLDWTSQMAGFWESRFDDLEQLLKRMDN